MMADLELCMIDGHRESWLTLLIYLNESAVRLYWLSAKLIVADLKISHS